MAVSTAGQVTRANQGVCMRVFVRVVVSLSHGKSLSEKHLCLRNLSELCPTESTPTDVHLSLSTPFIHASVRLSCIMSQRHLNTWFATALRIPHHFALKSSVLRAEFCRICGAFHYQWHSREGQVIRTSSTRGLLYPPLSRSMHSHSCPDAFNCKNWCYAACD